MDPYELKLTYALSKMFNQEIINAGYQTVPLHGGTLGDIQLVTGTCKNANDKEMSYKIVTKRQKKWARHGDHLSWRREYDLYNSAFETLFSDSFRMPKCYHLEMNEDENEWQMWLEYIDGISGLDLTAHMYELAAKELGRFQGKLYATKPDIVQNLHNLSNLEYAKNFYLHYRSWPEVYDYIRSDTCELPEHLCEMLIDIDLGENEIWDSIGKLPVVLCHRDFWVTNIFHTNQGIILIDWDTTGWGHFGEDLASLIADEADVPKMALLYQKCVPAYYEGFSEFVDVSHITHHCIRELILVMFGYRLVEWYKFAKSPDEKKLHLDTLQKIYEMKSTH